MSNLQTISLWPQGAPYAEGSGPDDQPYIVPYLLENNPGAPAVIVCPGGGYARKAEHEGGPVAEWLNSIGIAAVVLQYRVAPYRHPVPLHDAQRAIRLVRSRAAEWGIDAGRVGILGFSAGGHLAASAGTLFDAGNPEAEDPIDRLSSRPDVMILCYPVINMIEFVHTGSRKNLLGPEPSAELAELLSPDLQVTENTPPAFIWFTADDPVVPVENSLMLATALSKHKIPYDLHIFESGRHGLGLAREHAEAQAWPALCETWLRKRGF